MSTANAIDAGRAVGVLDGFPEALVSARARDGIARYCRALDVLGRLEPASGRPLADQHTLRSLLAEFMGRPRADHLIGLLACLPAPALRPALALGPPVEEVPWFGLASRIAIFDSTPGVTYTQLAVPPHAEEGELVAAVQHRFPSMEPELLAAEPLPGRLRGLAAGDPWARPALAELARQLGWWAALTAVLLTAPAALTEPVGDDPADAVLARHVWPLVMYLMAGAVGGWTLTVVGGVLLAPTDGGP